MRENSEKTWLANSLDKSYQDKDTDFIVWKKNGKTFGLEAKVDSHNTGNFYLETSVDYFSMVPDALNEQRVARRYRDGIDPLWHTPGWVYRSGADQILYYFRTTQLLYIFSRVDVWFYAESCNLPEPQGICDALAPTTRYSGILMFVYNLDIIYCVFSLTGYHIYGIIQLFSGRGTAPETSRFSFPQSWSHGFI